MDFKRQISAGCSAPVEAPSPRRKGDDDPDPMLNFNEQSQMLEGKSLTEIRLAGLMEANLDAPLINNLLVDRKVTSLALTVTPPFYPKLF